MVASPDDVLTTMMVSSTLKGWGSTTSMAWLMPLTLFPAIGSKSTVHSHGYIRFLPLDAESTHDQCQVWSKSYTAAIRTDWHAPHGAEDLLAHSAPAQHTIRK